MTSTGSEKPATDNKIEKLMADLESKEGVRRMEARHQLIETGKAAIPYLIEALDSKKQRVRWEATKTLGAMQAPEAATALVKKLMDDSFEVQWLAAEGLIALKRAAVHPLLKALTTHFDNLDLRQGAHHILHALERENLLDEKTLKVLDELRDIEPLEPFPGVAEAALNALAENKPD
jgi:HEAT repeat protein